LIAIDKVLRKGWTYTVVRITSENVCEGVPQICSETRRKDILMLVLLFSLPEN
jgi:hypothetical protein